MGVETELREELEGEGDGAHEGEEGRLLALDETVSVASFDETGTDRDLVFFMFLSAPLCPARFSIGFSTPCSYSLVLFKDEEQGGGISSTSISESCCCWFFCCFCCFFLLLLILWSLLKLLIFCQLFL